MPFVAGASTLLYDWLLFDSLYMCV